MDSCVLRLDDYQALFRSPADYRSLVDLLRDAVRSSRVQHLLADGEVVGTVIGPELSRDLLLQGITRKLGEDPEFLNELRRRLEDDPIVD